MNVHEGTCTWSLCMATLTPKKLIGGIVILHLQQNIYVMLFFISILRKTIKNCIEISKE